VEQKKKSHRTGGWVGGGKRDSSLGWWKKGRGDNKNARRDKVTARETNGEGGLEDQTNPLNARTWGKED